jgi:transposase
MQPYSIDFRQKINARIHLGEMVKEAIEQAGAKLIYLSPYSPEFSPIEN